MKKKRILFIVIIILLISGGLLYFRINKAVAGPTGAMYSLKAKEGETLLDQPQEIYAEDHLRFMNLKINPIAGTFPESADDTVNIEMGTDGQVQDSGFVETKEGKGYVKVLITNDKGEIVLEESVKCNEEFKKLFTLKKDVNYTFQLVAADGFAGKIVYSSRIY